MTIKLEWCPIHHVEDDCTLSARKPKTSPMTILHSGCPGKIDIHAPAYVLDHVSDLSKHTMMEWKCLGCLTRLLVFYERETI